MKISTRGINFIMGNEGLRLIAYKDVGGVWTIGNGIIEYPSKWSGSKHGPVKEGDVITRAEAYELLMDQVKQKVDGVNEALKGKVIKQNQFDAIVDLAFNIGVAAFKRSTLLDKLLINPEDPAILDEFMRWNKVHGKEVKGLTLRRGQEAKMYFNK